MAQSLSRRSLLKLAGAGAAAVDGLPTLAACGTGSTATVSNVGAKPAPWPA